MEREHEWLYNFEALKLRVAMFVENYGPHELFYDEEIMRLFGLLTPPLTHIKPSMEPGLPLDDIEEL